MASHLKWAISQVIGSAPDISSFPTEATKGPDRKQLHTKGFVTDKEFYTGWMLPLFLPTIYSYSLRQGVSYSDDFSLAMLTKFCTTNSSSKKIIMKLLGLQALQPGITLWV